SDLGRGFVFGTLEGGGRDDGTQHDQRSDQGGSPPLTDDRDVAQCGRHVFPLPRSGESARAPRSGKCPKTGILVPDNVPHSAERAAVVVESAHRDATQWVSRRAGPPPGSCSYCFRWSAARCWPLLRNLGGRSSETQTELAT